MPKGRPPDKVKRVKMQIHVLPTTKSMILGGVVRGNRNRNTSGKVVDEKFKEEK